MQPPQRASRTTETTVVLDHACDPPASRSDATRSWSSAPATGTSRSSARPDEVLRYFGVTEFDEIYDRLADELTPADWGERFRATPAHAAIEAGQTEPQPGGTPFSPRQAVARSGSRAAPVPGSYQPPELRPLRPLPGQLRPARDAAGRDHPAAARPVPVESLRRGQRERDGTAPSSSTRSASSSSCSACSSRSRRSSRSARSSVASGW